MRRAISGFFYVLTGLWVIANFVYGFLTFFVRSYNEQTHTWTDILGRTLTPTPLLLRLIFDQDSVWVGWSWFLLEVGGFWIVLLMLVGIAVKLDPDD